MLNNAKKLQNNRKCKKNINKITENFNITQTKTNTSFKL
jgi:hypothetical protein